jgi:hypothetical protein
MKLAAKLGIPIGALACCLAVAQTDAARDRLAKHAELFRRYNSAHRLENTRPNAQGIIDLSVEMINDYAANPTPRTPDEEFAILARYADAVVAGTATSQMSALNPQHSFVYSDWTINVTEIFKATPKVQILLGAELTVFRPGGALTISGQRVSARDPGFPDFIVGHKYVFYLPAHPDSSSFWAIPGESFDVTGEKPLLLADEHDPTALKAFIASASITDLFAAVERSVAK